MLGVICSYLAFQLQEPPPPTPVCTVWGLRGSGESRWLAGDSCGVPELLKGRREFPAGGNATQGVPSLHLSCAQAQTHRDEGLQASQKKEAAARLEEASGDFGCCPLKGGQSQAVSPAK